MTDQKQIQFIQSSAVINTHQEYLDIIVDVPRVLESWRLSIFSFEWLDQNGKIRPLESLAEHEQPKRRLVEEKLKNAQAIEKPILGIGVGDNIEIGSGRASFLTLAARGLKFIPVHIPQSNESDFQLFLADIDS